MRKLYDLFSIIFDDKGIFFIFFEEKIPITYKPKPFVTMAFLQQIIYKLLRETVSPPRCGIVPASTPSRASS